ncbi:alpha/beta hydrolase [Thermaurantimonas aggregans]|uniref:Alpha/beta hydrolase n=2 Tax=Thermaurantimonas aggregans TaxID=2173829 RepID=A0A401XN95_9FLAO|nr:alpha/beta hydrolase [Thermaurantimonas aggregans]
MATDHRAFEVFKKHFSHPYTYIPWVEPERTESLSDYTQRMISPHLKDSGAVRVAIGLSFGGVVALHGLDQGFFTHVILVSSVKGRDEFSPFFRFLRIVPIYRMLPDSWLKSILVGSGLIPAGLRHEHQLMFRQMFDQFSPSYFKWCVDRLIHIPKSKQQKNVYHIHGTHDEVFAYRYICSAEAVPGGSHLMIVTRAKEISRMVEQILQQIKQTNTIQV